MISALQPLSRQEALEFLMLQGGAPTASQSRLHQRSKEGQQIARELSATSPLREK